MKKVFIPNEEIELENGIVFIGANGSGKTRLGSFIDIHQKNRERSHRITAHKALSFPDHCQIISEKSAKESLLCGASSEQRGRNNYDKVVYRLQNKPETILMNDYEKLLVYLCSDHNEQACQYLNDSKNTISKIPPIETKLDKVLKIWGELLPHRELLHKSAVIQPCIKGNKATKYKGSEMSDGERIIFYFIGQCLSAPQDGIIIIDEPELHLHPSIRDELWNKIEQERNDCLFIYITHDVSFAASRVAFKKIWIKQYDIQKKTWEFEEIPHENEIPEELLIELYGSRKEVLLVEGSNSSPDVQLYKNIFPELLIKPCGSCENVINYTKTLKSNSSLHHLKIHGLIDRDRRKEEEINALSKSGIYTLNVAEIENLFVTPEILKIISDNQNYTDFEEKLAIVKEIVFKELKDELEKQISEHAAREINFLFYKNSFSSKTKDELINNHNKISILTDPSLIFSDIENRFNEIILNQNYEELLAFYNRKTLSTHISGIFGLKNNALPELVIRLSQNEQHHNRIKEAISKYMPGDFLEPRGTSPQTKIIEVIESEEPNAIT